jgi:hypothetical protein
VCGISATDSTNRILRTAYFTLRQAWKGSGPFMTVSLEPDVSTLTWTGAIAGQAVWKVADQRIKIVADTTSSTIWGVQIYTDNATAGAVPRYTGDTSKAFNVVASNNTTQGLPLCWKVTDEVLTNPVTPPVWLADRGDAEHTEGFTDYQWRWMKDVSQTTNQFVPFEEYARVWDQNGIYWADRVGLDCDPIAGGNQTCPARGDSPNYVYVGLQLNRSLAQSYGTNRLVIEFVFP